MSEELRPCGFCGHGGARVIVVDEVTDAGCEEATVPLYAASCPYCGARGPMALSEDEAVAAWNRRHERTCRIVEEIDEVETELGLIEVRTYLCGECHGRMAPDDAYCPNCGAKVVDE